MVMQIFVKTLSGNTLTIDIDPRDTIYMVKQKAAKQLDTIAVEQMCLIFAGKMLEDFHTISYYLISKESTLHVLFWWRKFMTKEGRILWSRSTNFLLDHYNIPSDYCQIIYPENYDPNQKISVDENPNNVVDLQLNIIPPDDEIALFIHYISHTKECNKYVFIKRNEPLYKIGDKLQFYSPFYMNDRRCLELKFMETELDVYKTPNDYAEILHSECMLNAHITPPANRITHATIVSIYIFMQRKLIYIPDEIVRMIGLFYCTYDRLLVCMDKEHGINMLNTSNGKRCQITVNSVSPSTSSVGYRFYGGYYCTVTNLKLPKSMQCYGKLLNCNNVDAIFHCGSQETNCKLLIYNPLHFETDININAYDIELPNINTAIHDDNCVIYDCCHNSFYCVNYGISKLDMNNYNKNNRWHSLANINVIGRNSVSLLIGRDNLFIIGGRECYKYMKEVEMIDISCVDCSKVIRLKDIPIDFCRGKQSTYIEMNNQIAVGYETVNIFDLQKEEWIMYEPKIQCSIRYHSHHGDAESCMWNDSINNNVIYIATKSHCIEWIDIRENAPKWNILWKKSFDKLMHGNVVRKHWYTFAHSSIFT